MKLSELQSIAHLLPPDTEVSIYNRQEIKLPKPVSTLVKQECGNYDGRYNMYCTNCGWSSEDIYISETPPTYCPKCGS